MQIPVHPDFVDLPFFERPDLTPYLIHLTRNTAAIDDHSAFDNLINILQTGEIRGSKTKKGFIKGPNPAACFMDIPFYALKYVLNGENSDPSDPRYEAFGVFVSKKRAYKNGCRPVLYLSNAETEQLRIPQDELWRVVRFETDVDGGWISWLHEREWRCKGDYPLLSPHTGVLVGNTTDVEKLNQLLRDTPDKFKVNPQTIIPLSIVCHGLTQLPKR
jgi:hypothetical protein